MSNNASSPRPLLLLLSREAQIIGVGQPLRCIELAPFNDAFITLHHRARVVAFFI
ncbi:MAG: hypothetical protein J0G95_12845 [Rhizobiales bacterium]|nr:hypothetical protein [Hyphomicrobiales bacterium]